MKRILCFGDSNTWGYVPSSNALRYSSDIRYPRVLNTLLGDEYEVIEEGLPGRTMATDDYEPGVGNRNGALEFGNTLYSSLPLEYIIIMLGTNDIKEPYNRSTKECADALENIYLAMIDKKLNGRINNNPIVIIVAPPLVGTSDPFFSKNAQEQAKLFNSYYKEVASKHNCLFIDNDGLEIGDDSVHLTPKGHAVLANKIYKTLNV